MSADYTNSEAYRISKEAEYYISNKLKAFGFKIEDISEELFGQYHSPFDILASCDGYSFLADVKVRSSNSFIPIPINRLITYKIYAPHTPVDDRILIFHTLKISAIDIYISIFDVEKLCYTIGPYYAVERYFTESLEGLRQILYRNKYII
jgi:hypothetical protein|tara:strand:+ start:24866 stop:25315 length:450 start_codon:yes stop_codon:yes gene_type:complete